MGCLRPVKSEASPGRMGGESQSPKPRAAVRQDHLWSFQKGLLGVHPQDRAIPEQVPGSKGWALPSVGHNHPGKCPQAQGAGESTWSSGLQEVSLRGAPQVVEICPHRKVIYTSEGVWEQVRRKWRHKKLQPQVLI